MSFLSGRKKTAVGLEIGTFAIRVAELSSQQIPPMLMHYSEIKLPAGSVVDGEISEVDEVAETLKKIWAEGKISSRNVVLGVANPKVLVRQIELPYMDEATLKGAINFQAQEYIPIPPEELILDYQLVGEYIGEDDQKMIEVLLVGAHREMIEKFCEAVEKAGLSVDVVYLSSLALVKSLIDEVEEIKKKPSTEETKKAPPTAGEEPTILANISADISNIVVIEKNVPRFARVMAFGGNEFTNAVASALAINFDEAEAIKKKIGLVRQENLNEIKDEKEKLAAEILRREAFKFADELRRSIEYYFGQELDKLNTQKLIICGGASEMINLVEFLEGVLKINVEKGSPLKRIQLSKTLPEEDVFKIEMHKSTISVVIGLAMRGMS